MDFGPDVIHCHDWQTGLIPAFIKIFFADEEKISRIKTVYSIHKIQYQGNYDMYFAADVLGIPLIRPACVETTAWGAATLAGLAVGVYSDTDELRREWRIEREFVPIMPETTRQTLLAGWHRAVERTMGWAK